MAVVKKITDPFNKANLLDVAGVLGISADYPTSGAVTFPNGDGTNEDEIISQMSAYNFDNVGYFTDASISHTLENEKIKESDSCGNTEIDNSVDLIPTLTATLQEIGNINLFAELIGQSVQTVPAAALVGLTLDKTFAGYTEFGKVTDAKEYDAGTTSITSVTGSVDGLLTLTTDYTVETDVDGNVGIELVAG